VEHRLEYLQQRRADRAKAVRRRRLLVGLGASAVVVGLVAVVLVATSGGSSSASAAKAQRPSAPVRHTRVHKAVSRANPERAQLAAAAHLATYGLPLYCGGPSKHVVALTFDDGPGPYTTLAIKKLREAHLSATFFLVGKSIQAWPGLAVQEKAVAAVGDHTMTHPFLPGLPQSEMVQEIADARTLIEHAAEQPVVVFRPPYGSRTPAIDAEAKSLGLVETLWTVDSADSLGANYAGIEQNVVAGLHNGYIILMHENRGQTIRALPVIFAAIAREHFRTVTVPQLIAEDPPSLAQLRAGGNGCGSGFHAGSGAS
jgi:peptidoglycan-N-acetylglucosamine deacetylase